MSRRAEKTKDWVRLGEQITRRRVALNWGRDELAARARISLRTVASLERGQNPSVRDVTRYAIEHVLGWAEGSVEAILAGGDPTVREPEEQGPTPPEDDLSYVLRWLPRLPPEAVTAARRTLEPYVAATQQMSARQRRASDRAARKATG